MDEFVAKLLRLQNEFIAGSLTAIQNARSRSSIVAFNTDSVVKSHVVLGLVKWRHALEDPEPDLRKALATARGAIQTLTELGEARALIALDPATVAFLGLLLEGAPDPWALAQLQAIGNFRKFKHDTIERHATRCVLEALLAPDPADAAAITSALVPKKRLDLFRLTFEAQLALVSARGTPRAADLAVAGGDLYCRRARTGFYSGGHDICGGGPLNKHMVDFELAALIRWCGPDLEGDLQARRFPHVRCWS